MIELEPFTRMSHSAMWKLQVAAYSQFGPLAWSKKGTPFYITSNPYTARQYALVTAGYLRDCVSGSCPIEIDPAHPLYILDLGAGTGRFGYLFMKQLLELLCIPALQNVRFRYVMTDITETNIAFWKEHPYLQPYISDGLLDFAFYMHSDETDSLKLEMREEAISPATCRNPLVVIGNYFFDTIPQDLFKVQDGKLFEGKVSLHVNEESLQGPVSPDNPEVINHLTTKYTYEPVDETQEYYSGFPEANDVLRLYAKRFDNIPFLFPIGAFESLRHFSKISGGRLFLLAGDQGVSTEEQVKMWGEPKLSLHGSFSISVSYHAIAEYFRLHNGFGLLTTLPNPLFAVLAGGLGGAESGFPETRAAFRIFLDQFEPKDYFNLIHYSEAEWRNPSLEYLLLLVKLGNWDPVNLHTFFGEIRGHLPSATEQEKQLLVETIHNTWQHFFPVSKEEGDFALNLGVLLYEIDRMEEALVYFKRAIEVSGERADAYLNMSLCYQKLQQPDKANEFLLKSQVNP